MRVGFAMELHRTPCSSSHVISRVHIYMSSESRDLIRRFLLAHYSLSRELYFLPVTNIWHFTLFFRVCIICHNVVWWGFHSVCSVSSHSMFVTSVDNDVIGVGQFYHRMSVWFLSACNGFYHSTQVRS